MLILLADDHELIREGVKLVLNGAHPEFKFLDAQDYAQTLNHIKANKQIDIILLDLAMPGLGRLEGLKQVRHSAPSIPIIVLSVFESADDVKLAFMHGANGYVPKSSTNKELAYAIDMVMQGETYIPESALSQPGIATGTLYDVHQKFKSQALDYDLTDRQRDVLKLLVEGCSNKEIGRKLDITEATVKTHLANIYRMLGLSNRTEAVRAALNIGLI